MTVKLDLTSEARRMATEMKSLATQIEDLNELYFDQGFDGGGADPIVDGDISDAGITASELANFISFAAQLDNLLNNAAVTQADWSVNLNVIRNVVLK